MADSETLIKPLYSTTRANQPVSLGRDTLHIACEGHQFTCPGVASLHLQPRLRLTLNADFSAQPEMGLRLGTAVGPITLQYGNHARPVNVLMVNSTSHSGPGGSTGTGTFIPNPEHLTICDDRRKWLAAVTFHVMNFPAFLSHGDEAKDLLYEPSTGGGQRLGRVFLEHAGWRIELQTLPEAGELIKQLRTEGGFAITHVGRLTRKNGSSFWISQAEAVLRDSAPVLCHSRGACGCRWCFRSAWTRWATGSSRNGAAIWPRRGSPVFPGSTITTARSSPRSFRASSTCCTTPTWESR